MSWTTGKTLTAKTLFSYGKGLVGGPAEISSVIISGTIDDLSTANVSVSCSNPSITSVASLDGSLDSVSIKAVADGRPIHLSFSGAYTPELGNAANLNFLSYAYNLNLYSQLDSAILEISANHYIWEKTLTFNITTADVSIAVDMRANVGYWYTLPTQPLIINFADDGYLLPNFEHIPFVFSPSPAQLRTLDIVAYTGVPSSDIELFPPEGDHTLGQIFSITQDAVVEISILTNNGLWYLGAQYPLVFAHLDDAYLAPNSLSIPFGFTPLTTQPAFIRVLPITENASADIQLTVDFTPNSLTTYTLPSTSIFTGSFYPPYPIIWESVSPNVVSNCSFKFIPPRTITLDRTLANVSRSITGIVPIVIDANFNVTLPTNLIFYANLITPIPLWLTFEKTLDTVVPSISLRFIPARTLTFDVTSGIDNAYFKILSSIDGTLDSTLVDTSSNIRGTVFVGVMDTSTRPATSLFVTKHAYGYLNVTTANESSSFSLRVPIHIYLTLDSSTDNITVRIRNVIDMTYYLSNSIDASESFNHIQNVSYFGEARNLFENEYMLDYSVDAANPSHTVNNLEYTYNLISLDTGIRTEYVLDGVGNKEVFVHQTYEYQLITLDLQTICEHSIFVALPMDNFISNSYDISLRILEINYPLSVNIIVEVQTSLNHIYYDLDTIDLKSTDYHVDYEIQAPAAGVIDVTLEDPSCGIRLVSRLNGVWVSSTNTISSNINLVILEHRYVDLEIDTEDSVSDIKGYISSKLWIDAFVGDVTSFIKGVTIYGNLQSTTGNPSVSFRGFAVLQATLSKTTDSSKVSFVLTAASNYVATANLVVDIPHADIYGIGSNICNLYVSGNPNSVYNTTDSTGHISRYWYALGIKFEGQIVHPYSTRISFITDDVEISCRAVIPEPIDLSFELYLDPITIQNKGSSTIRLSLGAVLTVPERFINVNFVHAALKVHVDLVTESVTPTVFLLTFLQIYVYSDLQPSGVLSNLELRCANGGQLKTESNSVICDFYGGGISIVFDPHTANPTAHLGVFVPYGIFVESSLDPCTSEFVLETPIQIIGGLRFYTENISGGFKVLGQVKGVLSGTTAYSSGSFNSTAVVGTLVSYCGSNLICEFFAKHRDAQTLDIIADTGSINSSIKIRDEIAVYFTPTLVNVICVVELKVPVPVDFKFSALLPNVIPEIDLHNGRAVNFSFEKTTQDVDSGLFFYHPLQAVIDAVTGNPDSLIFGKIPERYYIDFTPDVISCTTDIYGHIPVYGFMQGFSRDVKSNIKVSTVACVIRSTLESPEIAIRLVIAFRVYVNISAKTDKPNPLLSLKIQSVGSFHKVLPNVSTSIVLHTYVRPAHRSGTFVSILQKATPNIRLNNPVIKLALNGTTSVFSGLRLVSLVQGSLDARTKDISTQGTLLDQKSTLGILNSQLENVSSRILVSIEVSVSLILTLDSVLNNLVFYTPMARHGPWVSIANDAFASFIGKSIQDTYVIRLDSNSGDVHTVEFVGKIPRRIISVLEPILGSPLMSLSGDVSRGGRLAGITPDIITTIVSLNVLTLINLSTDDCKARFNLSIKPLVQGFIRKTLENISCDIPISCGTIGYIDVVTAEPSFVRFRAVKEIYGKIIAWDCLAGDQGPLGENDFYDPIYMGFPLTYDDKVKRFEYLHELHKRDYHTGVPLYDDLKRTQYVHAEFQLNIRESFLIKIDIDFNEIYHLEQVEDFNITYEMVTGLNTGTVLNLTRWMFMPWMSLRGNVEVYGVINPVLKDIKPRLYLSNWTIQGNLNVLMDKFESAVDICKMVLLNGSAGALIELQTAPAKFFSVVRVTQPGYLRSTLNSVISNFYATGPFIASGTLDTVTSSPKSRIVCEVRIFHYAGWWALTDWATSNISILCHATIRAITLTTDPVSSSFLLSNEAIVGSISNYLRSVQTKIKINVPPFSNTKIDFFTRTETVYSSFVQRTDIYMMLLIRNTSCSVSINLIAPVPLFIEMESTLSNVESSIPMVVEIFGTLNVTTEGVISLEQLLFIELKIGTLNSVLSDVTSSLYLYIPTHVSLDLVTQSISSIIDIRFMSVLTFESVLQDAIYYSRINAYTKSSDLISDMYYGIKGVIIPDTHSSSFRSKGYIRVYDGTTGELVKEVYTATLDYQVPDLIEGEYSVVFDPDSQQRLKVRSKIKVSD